MKLQRLTVSGLKGHDRSLDFTAPVSVLIGDNGAGKTEVLQALSLLATGTTVGVAKNAEGVMRLARGDRIEIRAVFDMGSVTRSWTRDSKGSVKEAITGSLVGKGSTKEAAGYLARVLGGWSEAWRPADLFALSPAKLRARLVSLLATGFDPADHVPAGAPEKLKPADGEGLDEWISRATSATRDALNEARRELREAEAALAAHVAEYGEMLSDESADAKGIEAELRGLRGELAAAAAHRAKHQQRQSDRAALAAALVSKRAELARYAGVLSATDLDVAAAEEEHEEASKEAARASAEMMATGRLVNQACPHCGKTARSKDEVAELGLVSAAADKRVSEARAALEAARRGYQVALLEESVREVEQRLQVLDAADDAPAPDTSAIEARIQDAERRLQLAARGVEMVAERERMTLAVTEYGRKTEVRKVMADRFAEVEATILDDVRQRIEGPVSDALGRPVTVELVDARGNASCRLAVDGVDVSAISTGEQIVFTVALLCALAAGARSEWKPLVIDCLESVHSTRRKAFLSALADACARGVIDQAFVAGCPDQVEAPEEGVEIMTLEHVGPSETEAEEKPKAEPREQVESSDPALEIPLIEVESSAIKAVGFDGTMDGGTLVVEFTPPAGEERGAVWAYPNSEESEHTTLVGAESIGKAWGVLKKRLAPGRQIAGPLPKKRRGAA